MLLSWHSRLAVLIVGVAFLVGCSRSPKRAQQPSFSSQAGADAIKMYDKDGDGAIIGDEMDRVPALRASIGSVDADKDGRITAQEIDSRVQHWRKSRIGEMPVACEVTLDGNPLANAEIIFEPESFAGTNLPSGSGKTSDTGSAGISLPADQLANPRFGGMPCGWYKIRITCPDEDIPAKYNSETILGCEVASYAHWLNAGAVKLNLISK